MSEIKMCEDCKDQFKWDDDIVIVGGEMYHTNCVEIYPTGYFAFLNGNPLGETENDDGQSAYEILDDEELLEVPE